MNIGFVGAGNVATALAKLFAGAGHTVALGAREASRDAGALALAS